MRVTIEKFDHFGRGIAYIDQKIVFVAKTIPGDIVDIKITKNKKNYLEGSVERLIKPSNNRIEAKCPYFNKCGGCDLQNISYENTIEFKKEKIINIFNKLGLKIDPIIIKNKYPYNYRNKVELKIVNKKIGFFASNIHNLIEIDNCLITNNYINDCIKDIKKLNIINGSITIRCNSTSDILLIINTKDKITNNINNKNIKGIIVNDKVIYGVDYLKETIGDYLFIYSYNSFFQINPYINNELFKIIKDNIDNEKNILDLYCGVGTLGIVASTNNNFVTGVEIIENAIINAKENAKINNCKNIKFINSDVKDGVLNLDNNYDLVIVDPPRKGLDKNTIDYLKKVNSQKIIYTSCDPQTLIRDIKLLNNYKVEKVYILDMFSYTYHLETVCILKQNY